ncbi:hypothetical protein AMYX_07050 [Anaeromyxobacter diazotrophicus]|uniref:Uncharacterized protein n=1 Tax=Anaeromyxobacter diazotrophicus TaxID=2590199 RepID=A0A7I9VHU6_9BACT|nr:hypothetical protein AMYX_07050 [Anaeromyxobacter diazotrophicus]
MPKGRTHTAEQIIRALREVDAGVKVGDVCRQLGVVEKYYGMEPSEARRLRELEDEFRPEGATLGYYGIVGHTAGRVFAGARAPRWFEELIARAMCRNRHRAAPPTAALRLPQGERKAATQQRSVSRRPSKNRT